MEEKNNNVSSLKQQDIRKYLVFSLEGEYFAINIMYITQIIGIQSITTIPDLPNYMKGVINLRGKIIPIMDARLRFNKTFKEYHDRTCIIILDMSGISVGLVVDSVTEVMDLAEKDISKPPNIKKRKNNYINGIAKAEGKVRLLLDTEKLIKDENLEEVREIL
ncbi:chemotaxis protein CheW [Dethiothermospora halolimnae]|uniref:chemotaxis protein CheW n=1 Tax=Dethiothermospora halolimnae TaxID=3114390 RepID=UPI003CCBC570